MPPDPGASRLGHCLGSRRPTLACARSDTLGPPRGRLPSCPLPCPRPHGVHGTAAERGSRQGTRAPCTPRLSPGASLLPGYLVQREGECQAGDRWPENGLQPPRGPHGALQAYAAWGLHLHRGLPCAGGEPGSAAPGSPRPRQHGSEGTARLWDMASLYVRGPVTLPRAPHWGKRNHRPEGTKVWPPEATAGKLIFCCLLGDKI